MSLADGSGNPGVSNARRNYSGWVAFALLMVLVVVGMAGTASDSKTRKLDGYADDQTILKNVMSAESLEKTLGSTAPKSQASTKDMLSKELDDPISGLVLRADKDPLAAMLYAEMRTYQKRPVPPEHLQALATSKYPEDQAFYKLYTAPTLTLQQAQDLIAKLPKRPFVYEAARVQALEKAGVKDAVSRYVSPFTSIGTVVLTVGAWPFIGVSMAIWMIFLRKSREKTLEPQGIPLEAITELDADRLAIRAAQIFALFLLTGLGVLVADHLLNLHLNDAEMNAIGGILTIGCVFALQPLPIEGKKILLSTMGLSTTNLQKDVVLGILGFFAEFPASIFLAEMFLVLTRWLPARGHPAEALEHTHDLRTVIPIFISACIVAPFWEEIVFRGLLFPGLKRLIGSLIPAIVLSSFIFASVHPQGIAEWAPLAFIGATSCYLTYQSRSLIPGMVMHCLHNAVLCAMMLLS